MLAKPELRNKKMGDLLHNTIDRHINALNGTTILSGWNCDLLTRIVLGSHGKTTITQPFLHINYTTCPGQEALGSQASYVLEIGSETAQSSLL